jgi:hypothetical protein
MGLIKFLISFIILLGYLPGDAAIAASAPVRQAVEIIEEDRKEQTTIFFSSISRSNIVADRRSAPPASFDQTTAARSFRVPGVIAFGSSVSVHCSKSAITSMYVRLLSVFNFPQRISLHPRHVYT